MKEEDGTIKHENFPNFDRKFFESSEDFTGIGDGSFGGKATGIAFIKKIIKERIQTENFPQIEVTIPRSAVIKTDNFDKYLKLNNLYEIAYSDARDDRIALAFQKANLPVENLGDLRALTENIHRPLAVRSSSLLEDREFEPFAGIYCTKMIANNEPNAGKRFQKLLEAIRFVYSSTFFKSAKNYISATKNSIQDEKMAVVIQEVVGNRFDDHFYPEISGVARSYNYYPSGRSKPEDGIVNLALGLGRTIVDEGISWAYCPKYPKIMPPYIDASDLLKQTQTEFWSVNMGKILNFNPIDEVEYLTQGGISEAEENPSFRYLASTYDSQGDRFRIGIGDKGPRLLNFATLLSLNEFKFNDLISHILEVCTDAVQKPVEIEFAITFDEKNKKMCFNFLQIRPMVVSTDSVTITDDELFSDNVLVSSNKVLGNGNIENLKDIVFVKPEKFEKRITSSIVSEVEEVNIGLLKSTTPYILIGFGRWGSTDPWLGIPVDWVHISGSKVIVESTLDEINVELSQGSHFFHNLTCFQVAYFSIRHDSKYCIDWDWLNRQTTVQETSFIKHVGLSQPLLARMDGLAGLGVITAGKES